MKKNAYWDELGIAWCAAQPETEIVIPRLKGRLRGQSFLLALCVTAGLLLGIAGALLGVWTLWTGWTNGAWNFVTRGTALIAVSAIMSVAALQLLPVMASDQARALPDMIDLTIARAERLLIAVRLGLVACAVAVVLGLAGTAIRILSGKPAAMSPIWPTAILAILALVLFLYSRHVRHRRRKFRYLKDALHEAPG
jgi:hypothetical protein